MRTRSFFSSLFVIPLLTLLSVGAEAGVLRPQLPYYPSEFYDRVTDAALSDSALKQELFQILSSAHLKTSGQDTLAPNCKGSRTDACYQHHSLGYGPARKIMFGDLHLRKTENGYAVFDVYCEKLVSEKDFSKDPPGPGQIPDSKILNAEHTWPQSHFTKKFPTMLQKSDLHILYPVWSEANSSRNNLDFGDVVSETTSPCDKAKRGYSTDGGRQVFFQPPPAHRGNVARAIFYFSVRYQVPVPAEEEASLRAWNRQDPPDDFERQRNDGIQIRQGDRNPFIDYPELIDRISDF